MCAHLRLEKAPCQYVTPIHKPCPYKLPPLPQSGASLSISVGPNAIVIPTSPITLRKKLALLAGSWVVHNHHNSPIDSNGDASNLKAHEDGVYMQVEAVFYEELGLLRASELFG